MSTCSLAYKAGILSGIAGQALIGTGAYAAAAGGQSLVRSLYVASQLLIGGGDLTGATAAEGEVVEALYTAGELASETAVEAALVAVLVAVGALSWENINIVDPDLLYPVVLLTKVLGAIIVIVLLVRVALLIVKGKVLTTAPHAYGAIRNLGTVLLITVVSVMACVVGVFLMVKKTGSIEYWPLVIVLIFGGLGAHGSRYLWREWRMYRRLRGNR